jgi:hypothetical protein
MLIVITTEGEPGSLAVSLLGVRTDDAKRCVGHDIAETLRRYVLWGRGADDGSIVAIRLRESQFGRQRELAMGKQTEAGSQAY